MNGKDLQVSDYIDAKAKIKKLGYDFSNSIIFLPYNFEESNKIEDMVYTPPEIILGKSLNIQDVKTDFITGQKELRPLEEIDAGVFTIMIPTNMFLFLPVVSRLLSIHLPLCYEKDQIGINFILERIDGTMKKIAYFGTLDGFKESGDEIIRLSKDAMGLSTSDIDKVIENISESGVINQLNLRIIKDAFKH